MVVWEAERVEILISTNDRREVVVCGVCGLWEAGLDQCPSN